MRSILNINLCFLEELEKKEKVILQVFKNCELFRIRLY